VVNKKEKAIIITIEYLVLEVLIKGNNNSNNQEMLVSNIKRQFKIKWRRQIPHRKVNI
jgi:hypothetical protein